MIKLPHISLLVALLLGYISANYYLAPKTFATPDLIGLTLEHAFIKSQEYNINLRLLAHEENESFLPDTVMDQKPSPKTMIKERQTIYLIINKAKSNPEFPDFKQKMKPEITQWLKAHNLKANFYEINNFKQQNNICFGQNVLPNKKIYDKKNLLFYISKNEKFVLLPSFVGRDLQTVLSFLKLNNLKYKLISNHNKANKITEQRPLAYSIFAEKTIPIIELKIT
jgi:beta-lactam-binding protein with PASTA domain